MIRWIGGLVLGVLLLGVGLAEAACTKGTDCYCDCVAGPATTGAYKNAACQARGAAVETSLTWRRAVDNAAIPACEDWDAPQLYTLNTTYTGGTSPYYGGWADISNGPLGGCPLGQNSYYNRRYGVGGGGWNSGQPTTPISPVPCSCSYNQCFEAAWAPGNAWQYPGAALSVLINGWFSSEVASFGAGPTGARGGGAGVFDGNASFGHRIPAGQSTGPRGSFNIANSPRNFGITMAMAYAPNSITSGIWNSAWKHNEWETVAQDNTNHTSLDGIFGFGQSGGAISPQAPFGYQFIFGTTPGETPAECASKNVTAQAQPVFIGYISCDGQPNILYGTTSAQFVRATHWPLNTWGCVQGQFSNMGLVNSRIQIWFTGQDGVRRALVDITRDLTNTIARGGYQKLIQNSYANANQGGQGNTPTNEVTYRYEDNLHMTNGAPVSCAQIGFGAVAPPVGASLSLDATGYIITGAVATLAPPTAGPTLIGFVHRARLSTTVLAVFGVGITVVGLVIVLRKGTRR